MEKNKIGIFIAMKRKEKGLTQVELGNMLYVTDKAISKWERGISLPDITIIDALAKVLGVTVNDILNGEVTNDNDIDIEKELLKVRTEMANQQRKKIIMLIVLFGMIMIMIILKNISFGYKIKKVYYNHANKEMYINIGIPKTSFLMKYHDKSYSFKNFRNASILENEVKHYLKTLDYLTCNDTIYYYNSKDNYSITAYGIQKHILYNTITYTIADGDYCYMKRVSEYNQKLGGLKRIHAMNSAYSKNNNWQDLMVVYFTDGVSDNNNLVYEFNASLKVSYLKRINGEISETILENSIGTYEIRDDKLYYYRTNITAEVRDIDIPKVSVFNIEDTQLVLLDNYLNKFYQYKIILK